MRVLATLALLSCALAAGCGGDSEGSAGGGVVRMEADSFSPPTITVQRGDTVTFENESGEDKWPASDVHPTHEEYPGFDAGKAVLDGESYEFMFDRPGRWGYHDHLKPEVKGTIVVE
jgi:plastocyanin